MIVTLGDVVEDIVVRTSGAIKVASDTDADIVRRRGGSAANVAAAAAGLGAEARFVGQVGADLVGDGLIAELAGQGVDVRFVHRSGRTATIVVLVDDMGERTMLVDTGSSRLLDGADPAWLQGAEVLHLTLYSLVDEPIASTSRVLAGLAIERGVPVSVDVSSVSVIERIGPRATLDLVAALEPSIVFANGDEAATLGLDGPLDGSAVIVKRGPSSCRAYGPTGAPVEVPALALGGVVDTTGAGDAFAAGVLVSGLWRSDLATACSEGHRVAHSLLASRLAD